MLPNNDRPDRSKWKELIDTLTDIAIKLKHDELATELKVFFSAIYKETERTISL